MVCNKEQENVTFAKIWQSLTITQSIRPEDNPKGFLLGGQPGTGKSNLIRTIETETNGNVVQYNFKFNILNFNPKSCPQILCITSLLYEDVMMNTTKQNIPQHILEWVQRASANNRRMMEDEEYRKKK